MKWNPPLTDDDLRKYSSRHIAYEVEMFFQVGQSLPHSVCATVNDRAMLESFVVHLRNLVDFLYPTRINRESDVVAAYYFDDRCRWQVIRPPADQIRPLLVARDRAHKTLVHLTIEREANALEWRIKELLLAMHPILQTFAARASSRLLDRSVAGAIPPVTVLWAMPEFSTSTSSYVGIYVSLGRRARSEFADECEEGEA